MQEIYKQIYEMAVVAVPFKLFDFYDESAVIHKGFKISKFKNGMYSWKDVRFDDYYEDVDPLITEKVIELGFIEALTRVMIHNDQDKLTELDRRVINIDKEIEYWVIESTKAYNRFKKNHAKLVASKTLSKPVKDKRKAIAVKRLEKEKKLYEKKRRILREEKEDIKADYIFYSNRINNFKQ